MFLSRKIGAILRGKATPFQVLSATTLGSLLGFVPGFFLPGDLGGGFAQAPGLILLLLCLVLVLNANLAVFGLTTLVAKLLSLVLLPLSYTIGTWLLEGPLEGLFHGLVNGRVTAWFGLEYYATSGGLVVGLVCGVLGGVLLNRTIRAIRTHMAGLEQGSERYQQLAQKRSVRLLTWLFLGKGKGKLTWQQLAEQRRFGMPVRIAGVVAAAVLVGSLWVFQSWFSTPILTRNLRAGLEAANGATVDLRTARLGLGDGTLQLEQLAIADREALDTDLLAADRVVARIDTGELLKKRFVIDELTADNARGGSPRATPGVRLPDAAPEPEPAPPPAGTRTIEDYLREFEVWKQRLAQAREWIETISGSDEAPAEAPSPEQQRQQQRDVRIAQERAGLARVVAKHLLDEAPRFLIRKIDIKGIGYSIGGRQDSFDLLASNVSDAPSLVAAAMALDLKAKSGLYAFSLAGRSAQNPALGLSFAIRQLPVDSVFGQLKIGGAPPVRGGTMDLSAKGALTGGGLQPLVVELPLQVLLQGATFAFAGSKETKVDSLLLPIGLRGPMTRPSVGLDDKVLQQALLAAGQQELANFVQGQAGQLLGGLPTDLQGVVDPTKSVGENVDAAKAKLEAEKKRLEDEAKKKAEEELKKRLPGGLKGLLPGGGERK